MKIIIKSIFILLISSISIYASIITFSDVNQDSKNLQGKFNKRIETLEIKAQNYESLLSMQGAFYQTLITILVFVFGFGGWVLVNNKIKKVQIDNDERLKSLRTALSMTLGDVNFILGNDSYNSNDSYQAFSIFLKGSKYLLESLNLYDNKKSIMNFLEDDLKNKNILALTGKLIIQLKQVEDILTNHILKGEFDKEIADNYAEIILVFEDLSKSTNSVISDQSKSISTSIVNYVKQKQLLNK